MTRAEWRVAVRLGLARMRGPDKMPRKPRPCPVRDGLIPSRQRPASEARALYRTRTLKDGRCCACGAVRDCEATRTYCRPCAVKHARRARLKRKLLTGQNSGHILAVSGRLSEPPA